jgi:hypothetical protein
MTAAVVLVVSAGCSTGTNYDITAPGKLMQELIHQRIRQIPYQHKQELLHNMIWLSQAGEQAISDLTEALSHENAKVRSSAAWVFGRMGDKRTIPALQKHANDTNPIVALEVSRALLLLGDYSMVTQLIGGLDSELQHVRYLCYEALRSVTGKSFDYDHRAADAGDRKKSVQEWQQWWEAQRNDPMFRTGQPASVSR